MPAYRHIWIVGPDGLCPPVAIGYFDQPNASVTPSHGDTTDANILTDGDDGTWIDFTSDINANNPDFHDNVGITFDHAYPDDLIPAPDAELVIYYKADQDFRFLLRESATLGVIARAEAFIGQTLSTPAEIGGSWRRAPLAFEGSWNHINIAELFTDLDGPSASGGWRLEVYPPFAPDDSTTINDHPSRIIEVLIAYQREVAGVMPPCRLFPRPDGLGVGSGRHYPPAKSRQGSGRRFGYY